MGRLSSYDGLEAKKPDLAAAVNRWRRRHGRGAPPRCASPILYLGGARRRNGCIGAGISVVESVRLLDEGAACPETTTTTQIAGRAWRGGGGRPPPPLITGGGAPPQGAQEGGV